MSRRARLIGFGMEEVADRFPANVEAAQGQGHRHGHGLGLRLSRYVGKHRVVEETNGHKPPRAERRRAKKANDFGFGS